MVLAAGGLLAPAVAQQQPATTTADVPRADFIRTMDAEFDRRDADRNGTITRAELQEFEQAEAAMQAREQNRLLFVQLDIDRDGAISPAEFAAVIGATPLQDVSPQMGRLDANRDLSISRLEYRAATLAGFDRLDTDLDGVVTEAEMRAANVPVQAR